MKNFKQIISVIKSHPGRFLIPVSKKWLYDVIKSIFGLLIFIGERFDMFIDMNLINKKTHISHCACYYGCELRNPENNNMINFPIPDT
jgi:hypothetical protein